MDRRTFRRLAAWSITAGTSAGVALLLVAVNATAASASLSRPMPALHAAVGPVLAVADLPTVVNNATRWLVGILAVLATFFLTLGGARYLTAGGDPSEVERAKSALRSAGIGYALALLAPVILTVLKSILGVQ